MRNNQLCVSSNWEGLCSPVLLGPISVRHQTKKLPAAVGSTHFWTGWGPLLGDCRFRLNRFRSITGMYRLHLRGGGRVSRGSSCQEVSWAVCSTLNLASVLNDHKLRGGSMFGRNVCKHIHLEHLDLIVHRHGVEETFVVVGRVPACWHVWMGIQFRRSQRKIISYPIPLHSVGGLVSMMFISDVKFWVPNGRILCTLHYSTLYTIIQFLAVLLINNLFTYYKGSIVKG
jgi:hypothetical protein